MPLLPALAFLVTACHVGSGPGTKAAATATAMARATIVAGPDIREVIEVEDPVPFGEQQAAVTVANTGERRVTFTLTVHFTTGGRTLTTETVTVKDLRPGRRQVVYLTASEPIPDPYDTARVEVEAMPAGD